MSTLGPYGQAAHTYWAAGWRGVLPLPARAKKHPPAGYTGGAGADPSYADVQAWVDGPEAAGNIALRLPADVLGIDVDAYDGKPGAATLRDTEATHGSLPPTWRTTSRDDGTSGIRLFRVPPGKSWADVGGAVEVIHRGWRYAVVWPSVHPENRTYRWVSPDGVTSTVPPAVDDLPLLPDTWTAAFATGDAKDIPRANLAAEAAAGWLATLPGAAGTPCTRITAAAAADTAALRTAAASAHNTGCAAAARLVRLAAEGHPGVLAVIGGVQAAFTGNVTDPHRHGAVRTAAEAAREWRDLLVSAVNLVCADMPPAPSCDCGGALTALIAGQHTPAVVVDGNTALAPQVHLEAVTRTSWWPRDLDAVLAGRTEDPPPTLLRRADGTALFYRGRINGLIGESESGKTWLALLATAQQLADGGHVVYLDFEDTAAGLVGRLRALGTTDTAMTRLHYIGPDEALHARAQNDLAETLTTTRPDLIILDGFNAAMTLLGLDLLDNNDATKFAQMLLKPLAGTGAGVIYVDHVPKAKEHRGKGGIGAQAKRAMTTGCAISVDVLEPFGRGMTGRLGLHVDKDRPGHVRAAAAEAKRIGRAVLTSDATTGAVRVVIEPPAATDGTPDSDGARAVLAERISDHLAAGGSATKRGIRSAMGGRAQTVDAALDWLVEAGYVARDGVPERGFTHKLLRSYTVASDLTQSACPSVSQRVPDTVSSGTGGVSQRRPPSVGGGRRDTHPAAPPDTAGPETGPGHAQPPTFPTVECTACGRTLAAVVARVHGGRCGACAEARP